MNWLEIEQLLEQFWDGNTSLAEEKKLKDAFLRSDIPDNLSSFKDYFNYANDQQKINLPNKDFETEISQKIYKSKNKSIRVINILAYAAGFLLIISSLFFLLKKDENNALKYEPLTVKELQIAQKYMGLLAGNMEQSVSFSNQHLEKFDFLNRSIIALQQHETSYKKQLNNLNQIEYIDKSFNQLKYLKTFEIVK